MTFAIRKYYSRLWIAGHCRSKRPPYRVLGRPLPQIIAAPPLFCPRCLCRLPLSDMRVLISQIFSLDCFVCDLTAPNMRLWDSLIHSTYWQIPELSPLQMRPNMRIIMSEYGIPLLHATYCQIRELSSGNMGVIPWYARHTTRYASCQSICDL